GYRFFPEDGLRRTRESFINLAPAGSIYSTAADMASYMIAILQDGRFDSQVLFSPKGAQLMRQRHHSGAPTQWGVGLGFTETERQGISWYGHDGGREGYFSFLFVSPDEGIGFFVVTNTDPLLGSPVFGLEDAFLSDFSDHLRPFEAEPQLGRNRDNEETVHLLSGAYKMLRTSTTSFTRISSLLLRMTLESTEDGALHGTLPGSPDLLVFHVSEDGLYWSEDGKNSLSFRLGPGGVPTHMYWNHVALERVPWYEAMALHIGILGASVLGLLSALAWPARWGWRQVRGRRPATDLARVRVLVGVPAALLLAFSLGLAVCVGHATEIVYGVPLVFKGLLTLPLVAATVFLSAIPETRRIYLQHLGSVYGRLHICVLLASCMGFLAFLSYWRLLGYWY
ncbi:MAG: serine hydrolase, partial [Gemmatimonadetes bacterium]|nr:serine hydrolase [Gemmatimonadota bacterium]